MDRQDVTKPLERASLELNTELYNSRSRNTAIKYKPCLYALWL